MHNNNNVLLINEQFTAVYPSLVKTLNSLTLAVVLQTIHFKANLTDDGWVHCSMQDLADTTGLSRDGVQRAMSKLRQMDLLFEDNQDGYNNSKSWRIDHDVLSQLASAALSQNIKVSGAKSQNSTAKAQNKHRDSALSTYIKETIKNTKETTRTYGDDVINACNLLADLIEQNGSKRPEVTDNWLRDMERLHRLDGRTWEQITAAINWVQNDSFWRANVMSPSKLRAQYDQLRLKAQAQQKQSAVTKTINWLTNINWDEQKEIGK